MMNKGELDVLAQGIRDNGRRLGLTWDISLASVIDPLLPSIRIDGDKTDLSNEINNITGHPLRRGDRVYLLLIPPNKTYVIGFAAPREWKPWPVTFTNLNPGNGEVITEYKIVDSICFWRLKVTLGTGSSVGSAPSFNLPVEPDPNLGDFDQVGWGVIRDASPFSARQVYVFRPTPTGFNAEFTFWNATPTLTSITATAPWTWTINDSMDLQGFYRI